jgi:hypothetical protein
VEYKVVLCGVYGCFRWSIRLCMWSIRLFYVEHKVVLRGVYGCFRWSIRLCRWSIRLF